MILLSRFILKGTSQAALIAASMAMLSLVPLIGWFTILVSGASVALVTLVQGYRYGMLVMLVAMIGSAIFAGLLFAQPLIALYFLLSVWLPVWLVAIVLRETVSLSLSVLLVAGISLLALLVMYLVFPGFEEYWRQPLNTLVTEIAKQSSDIPMSELKHMEAVAIRLIPGLIACTLLFATTLSLMLARWWQAVNFNPGGFATEFRALRLGKTAAVVAILIMAMTLWLQSDLMFAMSLVVFALYVLQGAAVLHGVVAARRVSQLWMYLVYVAILFVPQILVPLVLIGLADTWIDIRRRLAV